SASSLRVWRSRFPWIRRTLQPPSRIGMGGFPSRCQSVGRKEIPPYDEGRNHERWGGTSFRPSFRWKAMPHLPAACFPGGSPKSENVAQSNACSPAPSFRIPFSEGCSEVRENFDEGPLERRIGEYAKRIAGGNFSRTS